MVLKINLLKTSGFIIFIIGVLIILLRPIIITGGVISTLHKLSAIENILGLAMIILGIIIFMGGDRLEKRVGNVNLPETPENTKSPEIQEYIERHTPSYLRDYRPSLFYNTMKSVGKIGLETLGKEKLPKGPKLFIVTHKRNWNEALRILGSIDEPVHFYVDKSLNWTPFRRAFLKP